MVDGFHVPTIPLGEIGDKIGAGKPSQNGAIGKKSGVITGSTVTNNVEGKVVTHCPTVGVKVQVVLPKLVVLIVAVFHVPVIGGELSDKVGKIGGVSP